MKIYSISILLFLFSLNATASLIPGVEEDLSLGAIVVNNYASSYDATSDMFAYAGEPFLYNDGSDVEAITNGSVLMNVNIDSSGEILGGSFILKGGIASLGLADDSLLLSGSVIEQAHQLDGISGVFKHDFLIELISSSLPNFDTGYALLDNHYWSYGLIDDSTVFDTNWGPWSAPLHTFVSPVKYRGVPEPTSLLLLGFGLLAMRRLYVKIS